MKKKKPATKSSSKFGDLVEGGFAFESKENEDRFEDPGKKTARTGALEKKTT